MLSNKKRINLMGLDVDVLTMEDTVELIGECIQGQKQIQHSCVNANSYYILQRDDSIRESINGSDIINADGQAVVWASKMLGKPLPERIPGIDLMDEIIRWAHKENAKVFFLGAEKDIVEKVVEIYSNTYSPSLIAGYRDGFFTENEETQLARQINESGASILLVAVPSPKKENFLNKYRDFMSNVYLLMGVGGSFDVVSGKVKRAPRWMQNNGLEWMYRLIKEPGRMWKRYLIGNAQFIKLVWVHFWRKKQ